MRFLLIVNPMAGRHRAQQRGRFIAEGLQAAGHGCEVRETRGPGHATELVAAEGALHDAVVAVGGDGTLHEVLVGLLEQAKPGADSSQADAAAPPLLGIVPAGSGDSVAMDLGIDDEREALARLLAGSTRAIDVARIDLAAVGAHPARRLFAANVLAWGAGARINRRAESMRWAGAGRYNVATVVELLTMGRGAQVPVVDGEPRTTDLLGVASLTRHSGRGLLLAPEALLDDGKLDLVFIARSSRLHLARTFAAVFQGAHLDLDGVTWRQASGFDLELGPQGELVIDGELLPCDRASIQMQLAGLNVLA